MQKANNFRGETPIIIVELKNNLTFLCDTAKNADELQIKILIGSQSQYQLLFSVC